MNNDDSLFRVVPLRKGHEGQGYTYYAAMQVSTGLYMNGEGVFSEPNAHAPRTRRSNSEYAAIGYAQTFGYTLDTQSELLVRMSTDGYELSILCNKLIGPFYKVQGEIVTQGCSTDYGELTFTIPADINVVRLRYLQMHGWVLAEEDLDHLAFTGRAWIPDVAWPRNYINVG